MLEDDVAELPFKDIAANSIRPEDGLMMRSSTRPIWLPEESLTVAPVSWVARNGWDELRPVELRLLLLLSLDELSEG